MSETEARWLDMCIKHPDKYKIYVDNDDIFVVETKNEESVIFSFRKYGYEFIYALMKYLGVNVEYV